MENLNQFKYYSHQIIRSMGITEGFTKKMFHETHPKFNKRFWAAYDKKDITTLRVLNEVINKLIDKLNGDIES